MSQDREDYIKLINANIKEILDDIVNSLQCDQAKKQALNDSLAFLANVVEIYTFDQEKLFSVTLNHLSQIKYLYQFEVQLLVTQLYSKFFSQLHVFRQGYEIAVLRLDLPKYRHLRVEEPMITITIPKPYLSPPLSQSKFIGEAKTLTMDDQDNEERFS